jgi:hypothetical protein
MQFFIKSFQTVLQEVRVILRAIFPLKHGILHPRPIDLKAATYMGSPKNWII